MSEIVSLVEGAAEGGLTARALGHWIFIEADSHDELREPVRDAVQCQFDEGDRPTIIRLQPGERVHAVQRVVRSCNFPCAICNLSTS